MGYLLTVAAPASCICHSSAHQIILINNYNKLIIPYITLFLFKFFCDLGLLNRPRLTHSIAYKTVSLALRAAKITVEFLLFTSYHQVRETDWEAIPQNTRRIKYSLQKKEQTVRPEEESFMLTSQLHGQDSIIISAFQMRRLRLRRRRRCGFNPWVGKIPWRKWQPTPVLLPGESHGQRSLPDYSPQGRKKLDTTE